MIQTFAHCGKRHDTPIENDATVLSENFLGENFHELPQNREFRKGFHPRKIPAIQYCKFNTGIYNELPTQHECTIKKNAFNARDKRVYH